MQKITPFLLFEGQAEEAISFYMSLFEDANIVHIMRYGPGDEMGTEGKVQLALFTLSGQQFMAIDSNIQHQFSFTPAISFYVNCESEAEIDRLYAALSEGGEIMMPLDAYPFSPKFCWLGDRFGVSWQLTLAQSQAA